MISYGNTCASHARYICHAMVWCVNWLSDWLYKYRMSWQRSYCWYKRFRQGGDGGSSNTSWLLT